MREADFLDQLNTLLETQVVGMPLEQKLKVVRDICQIFEQSDKTNSKLGCRIVPFITGRRPIDEATHPGLGSSEHVSMILDKTNSDGANVTYILYYLTGLETLPERDLASITIDVTLSFANSDGLLQTVPIPGWDKRPISPTILVNEEGKPVLRRVALQKTAEQRLVLPLVPEQDFLPNSPTWWNALDEQIRTSATDTPDPFTFGTLFLQMLHVHVRVVQHGVPVATAQTWVDVCDTQRFGSLYQRIIDHLIKPDTEKQAHQAGVGELDYAYHPWFPVLLIGSDKAALYTRALLEDIVHKKRHLTDPRWLMRVGLYLEFLTCIGIFEAVREEMGDLLTPAERNAYENSPTFAEIRKRLNPDGWRRVWELRKISLPKFGTPKTGPVSVLNLLQKKKATLAFLEVHHNDLKHAIELAGANQHNAQETWHRVFRDAERAVLRKTPLAFPELGFLSDNVQNFVMWHQKGKLDIAGFNLVPKQFSSLFGDQDGLFASACNQYRASMNEVAEWAKHTGLMDYTGQECVPPQVSLLQAYLAGQTAQLERLQQRDGYPGDLNLTMPMVDALLPATEEIYQLLRDVPIFSILTQDEIERLAKSARYINLGPMERIIIEGREGSSLFVVGNGRLNVFVRQPDGVDHLIDVKSKGDMIGEMSLLTGAPRSATVQAAAEGGTVYEIGKKQYEPIIQARPELVDELVRLMEEHVQRIREESASYNAAYTTTDLRHRIWYFFFGR